MTKISVKVVYDHNTRKWIIVGDFRKICLYWDMENQECLLTGHTCLNPTPELCNLHSLNFYSEELIRICMEKVKKRYGSLKKWWNY